MKNLIVLSICCLITACSSILPQYFYDVKHYEDEFDGYVVDQMTGNYITEVDGYGHSITFNASRLITKEKSFFYSLDIIYTASDWIFIPEGGTLTMIVDGERFELEGKGSSGRRDTKSGQFGAGIIEYSDYPVEYDFLKSLAYAKEVKFKLRGSRGFVTGIFDLTNTSNFERFISTYKPQ